MDTTAVVYSGAVYLRKGAAGPKPGLYALICGTVQAPLIEPLNANRRT
jgi:hypothetical protein